MSAQFQQNIRTNQSVRDTLDYVRDHAENLYTLCQAHGLNDIASHFHQAYLEASEKQGKFDQVWPVNNSGQPN